jgi:drug/metabolite transporter (DMT)-like permease
MAVVAPVSAVSATAIPVGVGFGLGERFPTAVWIGVALAIPAMYLVGAGGKVAGSGLGLGLLAGVGFAGFFVALSASSDTAGLWPLIPARFASMTLVGAVAAVRRENLSPPPDRLIVAAAGAGDMAANLAYLLAVQQGPLTSTVVLASLYPAVTVLLARTVLHEAIRRSQWGGIVLAVAAVALIATGT